MSPTRRRAVAQCEHSSRWKRSGSGPPLDGPIGEGSKSWSSAGDVIGAMLDHGIQRNDVVVALGGGVVGDLAGFAAAVVLRGVGLIQIPTSLLAMVDSSVGGKTAVNHLAGKNLIGAFYQPPLVCVDPELLGTLPTRELTQGWAEVIKHAVIQPSTPEGSVRISWRSWIGISQPRCAQGTGAVICHPSQYRTESIRRRGRRARGISARDPQLRTYDRPCHRGRGVSLPSWRGDRRRDSRGQSHCGTDRQDRTSTRA